MHSDIFMLNTLFFFYQHANFSDDLSINFLILSTPQSLNDKENYEKKAYVYTFALDFWVNWCMPIYHDTSDQHLSLCVNIFRLFYTFSQYSYLLTFQQQYDAVK